jgi:DNA-binding transcriptional MerR regulator
VRYTVGDVAKLAGCSSYLVRRLNNLGYLKCGRDYRNRRIFTDPDRAAKAIRQLLGENVADKESEEA